MIIYIKLAVLNSCISLFHKEIWAQSYDQNSFTYFNVESNPASVASSASNKLIRSNLIIQRDFHREDFSVSTYSNKCFMGLGAFISNQNVESNRCVSAGVSGGYRNVLFNKVKVRLGLSVKSNLINSQKGYFDAYSFVVFQEKKYSQNSLNFNVSVSLTDKLDRFFVLYGDLNNQFVTTQEILFKRYRYVTMGNLYSKSFFSSKWQLNYSIIQTSLDEMRFINHQMFSSFTSTLSRKYKLIYSNFFGYWSASYFRIFPSFSIYWIHSKNTGHRYIQTKKEKGFLVSAGVDLGIAQDFSAFAYFPSPRISFKIKLI